MVRSDSRSTGHASAGVRWLCRVYPPLPDGLTDEDAASRHSEARKGLKHRLIDLGPGTAEHQRKKRAINVATFLLSRSSLISESINDYQS